MSPSVPKPTPKPKAPRKEPNRANLKRKALAFIRAYGSESRLHFIAALPCVICGFSIDNSSENVHVRGGGASLKAAASAIVPMCHYHHARLHQIGVKTFSTDHGVDLDALAAETQSRWLATHPGTP